ncbi:MAG: hypothetical protein QOH56_2797 [Pseudonocardiales bacterium]|nr:hypothetical protein [Pseudonocardiales bacterium]
MTTAAMEMNQAALYAALLASDLGEFVAMGQPFGTVNGSITALVKSPGLLAGVDESLTGQVQKVANEASQLWNRRNDVAHVAWIENPDSDTNGQFTLRFRRNGARTVISWTMEDLNRLALDAANCTADLSGLQHAVRAARLPVDAKSLD